MIDRKAIKRYHQRMDKRLAERGVLFKGNRYDYNDKHDKLGRFATKNGSETVTVSSKKFGKMTRNDVKVNGPKQTEEYVASYQKQHPEIEEKAKEFKSVLGNVKNFKEKFPDAENYNSYNPVTGEKMNTTDGYIVTFHQNYEIGNEYGAYDDDSYAKMCAIAVNELNPEQTYIGYYDSIEISFNCADFETAKKFAIENNQHTVYNSAKDTYWFNPFYDKEKNPLPMTEDD